MMYTVDKIDTNKRVNLNQSKKKWIQDDEDGKDAQARQGAVSKSSTILDTMQGMHRPIHNICIV